MDYGIRHGRSECITLYSRNFYLDHTIGSSGVAGASEASSSS
ncbi:MAG: hypothetical protein ACJZ82_04330 [Paracoccaceae bacterium]